MFTTLISVPALSSLVASDSAVVILDCRFNLMDSEQGRRLYDEGHIPGAHYVHLNNDLSATVTPSTGRHPLPDFDEFGCKLSRWGVDAATQVVVYDDCAGAMAARAWWLLRLLGFEKAAVLDGGFPAWVGAGEPVALTVPALRASVARMAGHPPQGINLHAGMLVCVADVESLQAGDLLVDARTPERFHGEQEPIDPVAGHIPGALNRPLQLNLERSGVFKPAAQLRKEWLALLSGRPPEAVIHYCGSGVTACHNYLAMEVAGLTGSRLYPGSWSEWIRNPAHPVAR